MPAYDFPTPEAAHFPSMVVVAITNACDFACTHCFHPRYVQSPEYCHHDMEMPVFRKIVDEMSDHPGSILRLIAWGEPLCHPELVDAIAYAANTAPGCPVTLITNGYRMPPDRSRAMMEAGLGLIEISIDATTEDAYRRVRFSSHTDAFDTVEGNVREMARLRGELGLGTRIAVSFIEYPTEQSRLDYAAFATRWEGGVDEVIRRPAHTFKGVLSLPRREGPRPPCYGLWARCNINPWGEINVCFNDWENRYVLGDLRTPDTTIAGVWRGPRLVELRADQCRGRFHGICEICRDYNPDAWSRPYEQVVGRCGPHV
jgi:pyruvate-formate lyase-activating enzyme